MGLADRMEDMEVRPAPAPSPEELREPASRPTGEELFEAMSEAEQDKMFGEETAELLRSGKIRLADLVTTVDMEAEPPMIHLVPLKELEG